MIQKNQIKYNSKYDKNSEITNQRRQNLKNIYTQMKKNIKTTYSQTKQKNKLNIITKSKLTENKNISNKNDNNLNSLYNKKSEESRNNNKAKLDKNIEEDLFNVEGDFFFNKTEKDIKLLYNKNNSKKILKNYCKPNFDIKSREKGRDIINKINNYYSNKDTNEIKDKKIFTNSNYSFNNKKLKENNRKKNSFEKIPKLMINKKIIIKDEYIKSKNLFEKLNSARLTNNENNKLNLNLNKEINSDIKTISSKNTSRISSQKLVDLKEKELNLGKIKKIKKNKIIKQIKIYGKKNHSMTINDSNKILFLNDTLKETIKKEKDKDKYNLVNLYNFPTIRNNIPFHKNKIIDSIDQDNSKNNILNDISVLNNTCFYFNDINMNSTFNNNLNVSVNQSENKKRTPIKYHYHNNSFNNLYNQSNFYSKPVARLKKRIFDSPLDKKEENTLNIKDNCNINNINNKEKDSLEIDVKGKNNCVIKELLITIKTLNQIINIQKKIIEEYMMKEIKSKKEMERKDKEIKDYKKACLKMMFLLKEEKEFNILNENNKKKHIIEFQLLKENIILKKLITKPILNIYGKIDEDIKSELDTTTKKFYKANINENGSTINFYKTNIQKDNIIEKENGNISLNPLYNIEIISNPIINKKREKSYENRKNKRKENVS